MYKPIGTIEWIHDVRRVLILLFEGALGSSMEVLAVFSEKKLSSLLLALIS